MDVETLATSAVKTSISKTDVLSPYINEKDKEPSWDGSIYIFSDKKKSKSNIKRIPVQVKGLTVKKQFKRPPRYSVSLSDLDNWLNDGGLILFVVFMDQHGDNCKIYYSSLLPIKIRTLKEFAKKRKRVDISLSLFPEDNDQKVSILLNFFDNRRKQMSFIDDRLFTQEELEKEGILENITFSVTAYGKQINDPESVLFQDDLYLYANTRGGSIPQPLSIMPTDLHIGKTLDSNVTVNGEHFYNSYRVVRSKTSLDYFFGSSTQIVFSEGEKSTINFKPSFMLADLINDTRFFVSMIENQGFSINDVHYPLYDLPDIDLHKYKARLSYCEDVKKMLDRMGAKKDLDISKVTEKDEINIRNFVSAMVYGKAIKFSDTEQNIIYGRFKIANLVLLTWAEKRDDGLYHLQSFSDDHDIALFDPEDRTKMKPMPISHFTLLKKQDYLDAANIDYYRASLCLLKSDTSSYVTNQITNSMLEMLSAYDSMELKESELIDLAEQYCIWLLNIDPDDPKTVLNYLQIIKRRRALENKELQQLENIRSACSSIDICCGASILLDDKIGANHYFDLMTNEQKQLFKRYPICSFGFAE